VLKGCSRRYLSSPVRRPRRTAEHPTAAAATTARTFNAPEAGRSPRPGRPELRGTGARTTYNKAVVILVDGRIRRRQQELCQVLTIEGYESSKDDQAEEGPPPTPTPPPPPPTTARSGGERTGAILRDLPRRIVDGPRVPSADCERIHKKSTKSSTNGRGRHRHRPDTSSRKVSESCPGLGG